MTFWTEANATSKSMTWETPAWLVDYLAPVFPWDLDVCAHRPNVCEHYLTARDNALQHEWRGLCWMNPPYGRGIGAWLRKARVSAEQGATVVCLVPARTDTTWWQRYVPWASWVTFIKGRLRFSDGDSGAPFPSALVVFGRLSEQQRLCLGGLGWSLTAEEVA